MRLIFFVNTQFDKKIRRKIEQKNFFILDKLNVKTTNVAKIINVRKKALRHYKEKYKCS